MGSINRAQQAYYLENSAYDEESRKKIYQSIEKIYNRVLMPTEDEN
jgi:hypothetical protein